MNFQKRLDEINKMSCSHFERAKLRAEVIFTAMEEAENENNVKQQKICSIKSQLDAISKMDCTAMEKAKRKAALLFAMMPTKYRRK